MNGRLQMGFESPIECGIVLVALAVWLFFPLLFVPSRRMSCVIVSIMMAGAAVCLARTGSRGPILAGFASFVEVFALGRRHGRVSSKALAAPCLAGILCLVLSLVMLPAGARMGNMVGGGDDSVLNRLELWRAAGPMSFIKPLTGIGAGESGHFFSQWYQPERLGYSYTGLLNSYLEIAVERGLPVFAGVMALGFVVVASSWLGVDGHPITWASRPCHPSPRHIPNIQLRYISAAGICAAASLLAVLLCGLTCTAQDYTTVNGIVLFNVAVLGIRAFVFRSALPWPKLAGGAACFSVLSLAVLWGWVGFHAGDYNSQVHLESGGVVRLVKTTGVEPDRGAHASRRTPFATEELGRDAQAGTRDACAPRSSMIQYEQKLLVFCDRAELGPLYGKKLRTMLAASPLYRECVILDPRRAPPETLPMGNYDIAVFGEAVRWLPALPSLGTKRWHVIHPRGGFSDAPEGVAMTVWLPKYDRTGRDAAWREEARECVTRRESGSPGGFCGMEVIHQAEGFFW